VSRIAVGAKAISAGLSAAGLIVMRDASQLPDNIGGARLH